MQDFRNIETWQLCRTLTVAVYAATRGFPPDERFGLSLQLRRSVVSIGANIAEGLGKATRKDSARCLQIAVSEGNETLHHLYTAFDLGYLQQTAFDDLDSRLATVRTKLLNLLFRIRPAPPKRRQSAP